MSQSHVNNVLIQSAGENRLSLETIEFVWSPNIWLKINKLSLNKNKSKYMTFHMPKKQIQHLTLKIDGINIEKVEEFNFLGLTMDTNLKWKKHWSTKSQISVQR